ncbi:methyltransferase domain-containing protein [Marinobacter sp. CHS3-4]|uniref:class I SAM-dependent methyltransferase n=1 Tax=Marinobacter sp. CHS3-4 TaxID=3045174 RepID=UPI0024B49705|nr:methyltransferase domain-containing protein [Marinobacter sp. CHS3-4]MDI9244971.1 methyltransferase domain-containing protein [Marinobacter sp. CHS3-4]
MKLHIGCGKKYLPGFKHLDVINFDHVDYVCDTRKLTMIEDETVSEIYASHILEHVVRSEVVTVLLEWKRVLKPGGLLRVAVPDFEAVVAEYLAGRELGSFQGLLYGGQTYDYNFHHVAFDFRTLEAFFKEAGFQGIEKYDWRDFLPADYDDFSRAYLPHMDFENGRCMSLNVVTRK